MCKKVRSVPGCLLVPPPLPDSTSSGLRNVIFFHSLSFSVLFGAIVVVAAAVAVDAMAI